MQDLNDLIDPALGYILTTAWDINNDGWIIAQGLNGSAERFSAFLLIPAMETALVDIRPQVLPVLRSGNTVRAAIELSEGQDIGLVDLSTVAITRVDGSVIPFPIPIAGPAEIGDLNGNGVPDLIVQFNPRAVRRWVSLGTAQITVSFSLTDGTPFEGADAILVTLWRRR